jgi:predicted transcriptional regulator
VAQFVGADRALKGLALMHVNQLELGPVRPAGVVVVDVDDSLRDALSAMLAADADYCSVKRDGELIGSVTVDQIREAAR